MGHLRRIDRGGRSERRTGLEANVSKSRQKNYSLGEKRI
jgi:hypothetical protein